MHVENGGSRRRVYSLWKICRVAEVGGWRLIRAALLGEGATGSAIGSVLLPCLLGNRQAIDTEVVANACDDEVSPTTVHDSREDEVCAEVPQLSLRRQGPKSRTGNGEVRVVDEEGTSNHGCQHDRPVWERLVCEVSQDDLSRHASKDQGHGQAVQDQMVVLQQVRVRGSKPSHGGYSKDDQGSPFVDCGEERLVPGSTCLCNVHQAGRYVGDEKCEEDDGNPKLLQCNVADLSLVGGKVVRKRSRPNLGAKVARHADEGTGEDQTLCSTLATGRKKTTRMTNLWAH
jgi:hypothetical protein